jgi:nitroimidazol reductase NimA-like FMN-containing flavoprotein (pyridoxamine 5'-phosphate oxidase superfamily)
VIMLPGAGEVREGDRELVPLDRAEAVRLLTGGRYGRLVFTHRALPEVMPVNYRVVDGAVVVRVADSSRAVEGAVDTVVAFQADEIDVASRTGWSVTVIGHTSEIVDREERARVLALPLVTWAGGRRDRLIRVPLDRVTGRRLRRRPQG